MGEFVRHEACEKCGSSDAKAVYANGSGWCFSCSGWFPAPGDGQTREEVCDDYKLLVLGEFRSLPSRGLSDSTCQKFGYHQLPGQQIANYHDAKGRLVAQKVKDPDKNFHWLGSARDAGLFGQQLWSAGGKRIVITEGEIDAMSVSQAQGNTWPAVSIKNGASGARKELAQHLEYLESFGEIVLMFDMDEPGRKAAAECAELFTPGKCKVAQLPLKDANDMLKAGRVRDLVSAVWQARAYQPDGLIEGVDLWAEVVKKPEHGLAYPWPSLDRVLYGQRRRELVGWTGGTGLGKTQLLREVAYDLTTRHQQRVGYISLEESPRTLALGQMSLHLDRRLHLPAVAGATSEAELAAAFAATLGSGRYLVCDPHWVQPAEILNRIRYMVLGAGCQWIMFDHISLTVGSDASDGDERKRIDELMYRMRSMVDELNFGVHFVTHLRKRMGTPHEEGGRVSLSDFRGSGSIAQVCNIGIGLERNQQATGAEKNRLTMRVLKNRYSGETGVAGELVFTEEGRMREAAIAAPVAAPPAAEEDRDF